LGGDRRGGILINFEGIVEDGYAWGQVRKTNNQVEAYGFLLGLSLAKKNGIKEMQMLGDSMLIINHMRYNSATQNIILNQIIKCSQGMISLFDHVTFFHVLRGNNQEADRQANLACWMNEESSNVNGIKEMIFIP